MTPAQQHEVLDVRVAAVRPGHEVVGIEVLRLMAPGEAAHALGDAQGSALCAGGESTGASEVQDLPVLIGDQQREQPRAGQPLRRGGLERPGPHDLAAVP